jgi:hypothetical protein
MTEIGSFKEAQAMKFLRGKSGTSAVEWLAVGVIVIAALGGVLLALFDTMRVKFQGINDAL